MSKPNSNGTDLPNPEPAENEPCIKCIGSARNEEEPNFFVRFRSNVCERWGLSHKVFYVGLGLIVLLVLLVVVVIALGAAFPHVPHSHRYPVCKDSECLRGASQIREAMGDTESPCTDLWTWTCGGWLAKYPLPKDKSIWNQKQQMVKEEARRVRELISTLNLPLHIGSVEWKLKHLYEACLDVDNVNIDEARPLMNIIMELGGWYILRNWNNEDFDAKKVLKQLHVKYGVSPFFKITVEPDPYSPQVNIIRISPSGLGLPDREYYYRDQNDRIQQAYKELIRDVVRDMSTTRNEADKFGTDMFFYEKRIAEITPKSHMLANPITICNHIKVSELKDTVSTIPFYDILTAMYPEANINETTEVIVSSLDYLMEISQIIATTDRQTMNGYLIWTLVQRYLPYLSEKFTSAVNNFNAELFGVRQPEERWEMCATLCQNFMGFAYDSLAERRSPINMETLSVVGETYASILGVVRQRLEEFESMPQLHQQLKQKLAQVQLQIGLPRTVMNTSFIKEYYTKLNIIKLNLFDSVRHGIEFKRKLQEMALIKPSQEHQVIANLIKSPPTVTYSPSSNLVVIPRSLLTQPYFESKFARAVIHGRLGVEIASALVSAVLPYGSFWISDRKLLSPYHMTVNESLQSIQSVQKCLWKYILNLNLAVSYEIANETALATLKHVAAVSVANEALKSFSARDHIHQPTLEEFEDPAIYFLSYSQTQCSDSTQQYQIYDTLVNFKLSQRSMLHLIWTQLPEFSEALGCSFDQKLQCLGVF